MPTPNSKLPFQRTLVVNAMEYAVLTGLIDSMLQSIENDNIAGTPKEGDRELYPIYVSLALKLALPNIPDNN